MYLNSKDIVKEVVDDSEITHKKVTTRFYENENYFYFEIINPYMDTLSTIIQIRNVSEKRKDAALQISIESTVQKTKQIRTEYASFSLPESMIENFIQAITKQK